MGIVAAALGAGVIFYLAKGGLGRAKAGDFTKFGVLLTAYLLVAFSRHFFRV